MDFLIVGLGGFLGAISRYSISLFEQKFQPTFPWATLFVNVFGCFLAGVIISWSAKALPLQREIFLFSSVGFLGAFTTFSAFGAQTIHLWISNQQILFVLNILSNLVLGLFAFCLGKLVMGKISL